MSVYTVKFPLEVTKATSTFSVIDDKNINEVVKFNIKSTVLTCQGERRSDLNFGCCAKSYLFEMSNDSNFQQLRRNIINQIAQYIPYIKVNSVVVKSAEQNDNSLYVLIEYRIPVINKKDIFELIISE